MNMQILSAVKSAGGEKKASKTVPNFPSLPLFFLNKKAFLNHIDKILKFVLRSGFYVLLCSHVHFLMFSVILASSIFVTRLGDKLLQLRKDGINQKVAKLKSEKTLARSNWEIKEM